MIFGDKLRKARLRAGLTQEALAQQLGVTCRTLQNYESGAIYPKKREVYAKLAAFFDTDVDHWLTEQDLPEVRSMAAKVDAWLRQSDLTEEELDEFMYLLQLTYREAKDRTRDMQR